MKIGGVGNRVVALYTLLLLGSRKFEIWKGFFVLCAFAQVVEPVLHLEKKLREMDRDKQSSKHTFGAWSDPTNKFCGWLDGLTSIGYAGPAPG